MAHEITSEDSMVSGSGRLPWHKLGVVLPGNISAEEALRHAKLDWTVEVEPVFDGDMAKIGSHRLVRRMDTRRVLGVVGSGWEPVQNRFLVTLAEAIGQVDDQQLEEAGIRPVIETAGSLRQGRIVWALVKLSEAKVADSPHLSYALVSNAHDGTRGFRIMPTDVRVVCANTLAMADQNAEASWVVERHTKNVNERVALSLEALGIANRATRTLYEVYQRMSVAPVTVDQAIKRIFEPSLRIDPRFTSQRVRISDAAVDNKKEATDQLVELFRTSPGVAGATAFDAFNAVTNWVDHMRPLRARNGEAADFDTESGAEQSFRFALMGDGARIKREALTLSKAFVS